MAPPPSPLPSLNSLRKYDLYVVATQTTESRKEPLQLLRNPSYVQVNITVSATLFSDNPCYYRIFEVPSTAGRPILVSSIIDAPALCRKVIKDILSDMGVHREFGECTWRHKYLNDEVVYEMSEVEDLDRLIENVCWFLFELKTQPHNKDFTFLNFNLVITKRIVVPDDEFEASCSWYRRMVDVDHCDFEDEFLSAGLNSKDTAPTQTTIQALKQSMKAEDSSPLRAYPVCFCNYGEDWIGRLLG